MTSGISSVTSTMKKPSFSISRWLEARGRSEYRSESANRGRTSVVDVLYIGGCQRSGSTLLDRMLGQTRGHISAGTVHHVAFRAADEADQLAWREAVAGADLYVTPVLDRQYFRSIYFREPGGVLFEIATDPPGFTRDEPVESLGTALKLPPWLEESRSRIEAVLPPIEVHETAGGAA